MALPPALKALLNAPKYAARASAYKASKMIPAGTGGLPRVPPRASLLEELFSKIGADAQQRGIGWGEWITVVVRALLMQTATMFALNSPGSLQIMHRFVMRSDASQELRPVSERVERACLMREVGVKCIGLIGTPKVRKRKLTQGINNLAALRAMVDADPDCAALMPTTPRRDIAANEWDTVREVGSNLFQDIYRDKTQKLLQVLAHSHPDLGLYIVQNEYGPLFAPPSMYRPRQEPSWEVNRIRVSLMNIAALHAQGGVGPQVTSHIYGLLRSKPSFEHIHGQERAGLDFLASTEGATWVLETVNRVAQVVDGTEDEDRELPEKPARL